MADTSIQLSTLQSFVDSAHYEVMGATLTRIEDIHSLPVVDLWVVRMDLESDRAQVLIEHLDGLGVPVIFDEADSYSSLDPEQCSRRFTKKIASAGFMAQAQESHQRRAKHVWVLAASAGGPEAVVKFVKNLDHDLGDIALVYVQHMDENMAAALVRSLERNGPYEVRYCSRATAICEQTIYLLSPSYEVDILDNGSLSPSKTPWAGLYRPSVDQVVAKIWRQYGKNSGVIVFSGMGDDGAKTCRMIKHAGGQVWVQSLDSCAVDSMPREVMNTQCVSYTGNPEQLARHFSVYHKKMTKPNSSTRCVL